jgi:ribosome modulation factor
MDASEAEHLIALVHACGLQAGTDPGKSRSDCPFCDDRMDLCRAWLAGFSIGRATLSSTPS